MKSIIAVLIGILSVYADVPVEVSIKEITHQIYIQDAPAEAVKRAGALMRSATLSSEEKQQVAELVRTAALRDGTPHTLHAAREVLAQHDLPYDEIRAAIALSGDGPRDPEANRTIKDALQYQWENFDWIHSNVDRHLFFEYLGHVVTNANITEVARVQANILHSIMWLYAHEKDRSGVEFALVERQYERLLSDLSRTYIGFTPSTILDAIERYNATAREYIRERQPYPAVLAHANIAVYGQRSSQESHASDTLTIILKRFKRNTFATMISEPLLERQVYKGVTILRNEMLKYDSFSVLARPLWSPNPKNPNAVNLLSFFRRHSIPSSNFVSQVEWEKPNIHALTNINVVVINVPNAITGRWTRAVWDERFAAVSNTIWETDALLDELRAYVATHETPCEQPAPDETALREQVNTALHIFLTEGPFKTTNALAAAQFLMAHDALVPAVKGSPTADALRDYPAFSASLFEWVWHVRGQKVVPVTTTTYAQWLAAYMLPKLDELDRALNAAKDRATERMLIEAFFSEYNLAMRYSVEVLDPATTLITFGNTVTAIQKRLRDAYEGADFDDYDANYALMYAYCLPAILDNIDEWSRFYFPSEHPLRSHIQSNNYVGWQIRGHINALADELRAPSQKSAKSFIETGEKMLSITGLPSLKEIVPDLEIPESEKDGKR